MVLKVVADVFWILITGVSILPALINNEVFHDEKGIGTGQVRSSLQPVEDKFVIHIQQTFKIAKVEFYVMVLCGYGSSQYYISSFIKHKQHVNIPKPQNFTNVRMT